MSGIQIIRTNIVSVTEILAFISQEIKVVKPHGGILYHIVVTHTDFDCRPCSFYLISLACAKHPKQFILSGFQEGFSSTVRADQTEEVKSVYTMHLSFESVFFPCRQITAYRITSITADVISLFVVRSYFKVGAKTPCIAIIRVHVCKQGHCFEFPIGRHPVLDNFSYTIRCLLSGMELFSDIEIPKDLKAMTGGDDIKVFIIPA